MSRYGAVIFCNRVEVVMEVEYIWSKEGDSHAEKDQTVGLPLRLP
jgi:hypothetical protein